MKDVKIVLNLRLTQEFSVYTTLHVIVTKEQILEVKKESYMWLEKEVQIK